MIKSFMIVVSLVAIVQEGCGQVNRNVDCRNCSPKDSTIVQRLSDMNFDSYHGKDVGKFLEDLAYNYDKYTPYFKKPGYIWTIIFSYSDSLTIDIKVSDLNQNKPLNFGYTFNIEEFKKKKISMICFRYAGRCIKGCKDEFCPD